MKITTFALAISLSGGAFAADDLQSMIEADAQKDPYALQDQSYIDNEYGQAAQPPGENNFEVQPGTAGSQLIPSETQKRLDKKRNNWQKYNSLNNKGIDRKPLSKRDNVHIDDYEYNLTID